MSTHAVITSRAASRIVNSRIAAQEAADNFDSTAPSFNTPAWSPTHMMTSYLYLACAIVFEVGGTLLLPTTENFTRPMPTVCMAICYLIAFYCLTFAVKTIPLAVVYAIWSGVGVSLIALFGAVVYRQSLEWPTIIGLILIVIGVALVNGHSNIASSS